MPADSFWVRQLFNVSARVFCALNATILLVFKPAKIKMSFILKDDVFDDDFQRNVAIFPSAVQAYIHAHIRSAKG